VRRGKEKSVLDTLRRRARTGDRALAATPAKVKSSGPSPSFGLALGGGAARGFAHIGVLRTLLAKGIVPEVVTGTSIGAVVGGCYAAGRLDDLEHWARNLTRRRVFGYLDISFSGAGLIGGDRLARQLDTALADIKIESLATRFAAIATEIDTGHEVWLTRGRLTDALRASYALPGIFAPVRVGGRWLVDGALVNPVPVSTTRALNARIVIGVNLNADMLGRGTTIPGHGTDDESEELAAEVIHQATGVRGLLSAERVLKRQFLGRKDRPGIPTVMVEAFNVMQDRITRARLAGDPADVMISPRLGHIGMFDFHRAQEAIEIGAEAAERTMESVKLAIEALA
jgi:NTE family protein